MVNSARENYVDKTHATNDGVVPYWMRRGQAPPA